TRSQSWPDWNRGSAVERAAQRALSSPPHGIAAKPTGRGTLRLLTPPPLAAHGCGRHWACLAHVSFWTISECLQIPPQTPSDCSSGAFRLLLRRLRIAPPAPSDDSFSAFDNPSAHMIILHNAAQSARGSESLIPIIHWACGAPATLDSPISEVRQPQPQARESAAAAPRYRGAGGKHRSPRARCAW